MSDSLYPTQGEFEALKADIDERFTNVQDQLSVLNSRITQSLDTRVVAEFPDENDQIREKVLTAFQDEFATLLAQLNRIEADIVLIKERLDLD